MKTWIFALMLGFATTANAQGQRASVPLWPNNNWNITAMQLRFDRYRAFRPDTTSVRPQSIMLRGKRNPAPVNSQNFQCGPYWVMPQPEPFSVPVDDHYNTVGEALVNGLLDFLIP